MSAVQAFEPHHASFDELPDVVAALSHAFFHDPVYRWLVPDDAQRHLSAGMFYSRFVDACWPHGAVYAAGAGAGAALWVPPGEPLVAEEDAERFERDLLDSAGDDAAAGRMAQLFALIDANHPPGDCWYLAFMGVAPPAQGRGIGSRLLARVLTRADRDGVPAYLEASCPENQRLYARHGFETIGQLSVADSPTIYPMWREPVRP